MTDGTAELAPFRGLFAILDTMERLGIRYAIGGSLASSLHGEPRSTADFPHSTCASAFSAGNALRRKSAARERAVAVSPSWLSRKLAAARITRSC